MADTLTIHATAVALDGVGVLLRGPPGSGKSDLALRLIDQGARLIADDQTALSRHGAPGAWRCAASVSSRSTMPPACRSPRCSI